MDLAAWTARDPGDPQTLHTNIGVISDNATVEYKTLDVTPFVREDIQNGRPMNQYRIRFTIDTDNDLMGDFLMMRSGNSPVTKPYLAIQYDTTTSIKGLPTIPSGFTLGQNYPNPFNSTTDVSFKLSNLNNVLLEVYDIQGRLVTTLVNEKKTEGTYTVRWNGRNKSGEYVSTGIYFYKLQVGNRHLIKKMILIR